MRLSSNKVVDLILDNKRLSLILLLAFLIKISFWLFLQPWDNRVVSENIIIGDAVEYNQLGVSLITNGSFEGFDSFRTPAYPVFLAMIYFVSGNSISFVLFVQIVISLLSILILYQIALIIFSKKAALLAALLFAIDIHQSLYNITLLTETLFVFIFLCSLYFFVKSIKDVNVFSICLFAFLLGVATLTRPITILFPFVILLFIFFFSKMELIKKLQFSIVFTLVFWLTVLPWIYHNYSKYGEAKLSSISGRKLLFTNVVYTEAFKSGKSLEEVKKGFYAKAKQQGVDTTNLNSFHNSKIYTSISKEYIKENFFLYCKMHFKGAVDLFAGLATKHLASVFHIKSHQLTVNPYQKTSLFTRLIDFFQNKTKVELFIAFVLIIYLFVNYCFFLFGTAALLQNGNIFIYLFLLILLYFSFVNGPMGLARFRVPIMPFISLIGAVGIINVYESKFLKKKNDR